MSKKSRGKLYALTIFIAVVAFFVAVTRGGASTASSSMQRTQVPNQPTPTVSQPTQYLQSPDLKTVESIAQNATVDPDQVSIASYSQKTGVVVISFQLGTALCCGIEQGAAQQTIYDLEKAYWTSNDYFSSVTVIADGTIWKNGASQSYGPVAKATLTQAKAGAIDWTFSSNTSVWPKYDYVWLSPSLSQ